jgi:hypothetical protein
VERCGLHSSGSGYGPLGGYCEHSNEPSGSVKGEKFLNSLVTVSFSRRTLLRGVGWWVSFPTFRFLCKEAL